LAVLDAAVASELLAAAWTQAMRGAKIRVGPAVDMRGRTAVAA
jgi:hypothetical protein